MSAAAYRRDIDGLRGIAILSVLLFHAFPALVPGGYIGVDIFFVISGYLITGILLRGRSDNSFSYREFYARRIRRIFPALITVLTFTWVAGWFILFPAEYAELGKHIGGSALFISNIVLWKEAGYFDSAAELKPLLHLWSLGVEEQFYILWPALLWLVHKKPSRARWLMLGLLAASLVANLLFTASNPTASFFLLHTRFWQLMLGGMLAYGERSGPTKINRRLIAWLGLELILLALIVLTKNSAYPGWRALLPTLGATFLIMAGQHAWVNRHILGNRILVAFGLISYPLYLWHWPLLAYARILHSDEPSPLTRMIAVLIAIALAWLTYRFIESPLRFGRFKRSSITIRNLLIGLFIMGLVGAVTWQMKGFVSIRPFDTSLMADTEKLDDFRTSQKPCDYSFGKDLSWCLVSGKNPPDIAIFGDSHADHLFPGVVNDTKHGWLLIGQSSCPPLKDAGVRYRDKPDECMEKNEQIINALAATPTIKTVALAARGMFYISDKAILPGLSGRNDPANYQMIGRWTPVVDNKANMYATGLIGTIWALESAGKKVVIFLDVPELNFLATRCIPRPLSLLAPDRSDACSMPRTEAMRAIKPYRDLMLSLARHPAYPARYYDPTEVLCDADRCYAGNEEMLFYRDNNHLSQRGSRKVMANFIRWLDE